MPNMENEEEFANGGSGSDSDNENFCDANANAPMGTDENDDVAKFPLHKAAFKGDRVELTRLLRKGCDVSQKDLHGKHIFKFWIPGCWT